MVKRMNNELKDIGAGIAGVLFMVIVAVAGIVGLAWLMYGVSLLLPG